MPRLEGNIILVNGATIKFRTEQTREQLQEEFRFSGTSDDSGYAHVTGRNDVGHDVDIHARREAIAAVVYTTEAKLGLGKK